VPGAGLCVLAGAESILAVGSPPVGDGGGAVDELLDEELLTEELLDDGLEELLDDEPAGPLAAGFRLGIAPKENVSVDM